MLLKVLGSSAMPRCPFSVWKPISGGSGSYRGDGPFRIVHHTTEGSSAAGAFSAFQANRSDPHFTVDNNRIYQHVDTAVAARSLANDPGGVETNHEMAIQIEVVAFAGKPKNIDTLRNVARLCRWLETIHNIPQVWPNGLPRTGTRDPGGHNRNATQWETKGGHYGHCHVPENSHWDPGYTKEEVDIIMAAPVRQLPSPLGMVADEMQPVEPQAGSDAGGSNQQPRALTSDGLESSETVDLLDQLRLDSHKITLPLDADGQGHEPIPVAWERVVSIVPMATRDNTGRWILCRAALAEEEGQTILVASGDANSSATIVVKVLTSATHAGEAQHSSCP